MKRIYLIASLLLGCSLSLTAQYLPFQGKLYFDGNPVNEAKNFTFIINNGGVSWNKTYQGVQVNNGLYAVELGPLPDNIFKDQPSHQLDILVDGNPLPSVTIYAPIENDPSVAEEVKDGVEWDEVTNKPTVDQSNTNELQLLSLSDDTLFLSNGNFVLLNPETEDLIVGNSLQVGGGDTTEYAVEHLGSTSDFSIGLTSVWQGFTPNEGGQLKNVSLKFANNNSTSIEFKITKGTPNGQAILNQNSPASQFSGILDFQVFDFSNLPTPVILNKNEDYFFRVAGVTNTVTFAYSTANPYFWGTSEIGPDADLSFSVKLEVITASSLEVDADGLQVDGRIKDKTGLVMPVGSIIPFAGQTVPEGWLLCNGAVVRSDIYPDLFAVLGTHWGSGNGQGTFNLPDLRGHFLRGRDAGKGKDPDAASRTNLSGDVVGDKVGSYQNYEFRRHTHGATATTSFPRVAGGAGDNSGIPFDNSYACGCETNSTNITTSVSLSEEGGEESRPINAYVDYIIKY
ncbi:tail fiber protein [Phaeodactylibacter xiamenensis]|uniref:tail fiber protein n=1 Tax=Phaeodactylibacter xiamenensis TaxID=1524460 RepID=UPI0006964812|nr:tail fiber protein [Phaeodactylibacter xiamenensis]